MATKKKRNRKKKGNGAGASDVEQAGRDVGARMLLALKDELLAIKNPGNPKQTVWGCLSEIQQDEILERFGKRIEHELTRGYQAILAGGVPAVHAHLAKVAFAPKGIQASLEIPQASAHRHELADFAGQDVLVILTEDLEDYLDSMKEVKPDRDQKELALDNQGKGEEPIDGTDADELKDLRTKCKAAATELNETDLLEQIDDWNAAHLRDYLAWARGDKALTAEHPAGEPGGG